MRPSACSSCAGRRTRTPPGWRSGACSARSSISSWPGPAGRSRCTRRTSTAGSSPPIRPSRPTPGSGGARTCARAPSSDGYEEIAAAITPELQTVWLNQKSPKDGLARRRARRQRRPRPPAGPVAGRPRPRLPADQYYSVTMSPLSRRSLLSAAGAALGPVLGAACAGPEAAQPGGAPTPTGQPVKLRYMGRGTIANQELQKAGLAEFQKRQPADHRGDGGAGAVPAGAAGADRRAATWMWPTPRSGTSACLAKQGGLVALDPFVARDVKKGDYYDYALESGRYNGTFYAFPYDGGTWALAYNKELFDQAQLKYPDDTLDLGAVRRERGRAPDGRPEGPAQRTRAASTRPDRAVRVGAPARALVVLGLGQRRGGALRRPQAGGHRLGVWRWRRSSGSQTWGRGGW